MQGRVFNVIVSDGKRRKLNKKLLSTLNEVMKILNVTLDGDRALDKQLAAEKKLEEDQVKAGLAKAQELAADKLGKAIEEGESIEVIKAKAKELAQIVQKLAEIEAKEPKVDPANRYKTVMKSPFLLHSRYLEEVVQIKQSERGKLGFEDNPEQLAWETAIEKSATAKCSISPEYLANPASMPTTKDGVNFELTRQMLMPPKRSTPPDTCPHPEPPYSRNRPK